MSDDQQKRRQKNDDVGEETLALLVNRGKGDAHELTPHFVYGKWPNFRVVKYEDFIRILQAVTCKDCKHYEKSTMKCFKPVDDEHSFHDYAAPIWKPDDFCSYGLRRENEEP